MKYKDNGQWKEIYVKALDSMPVGTEIDFDGQASDIPVGWEQVDDKGEIYSTTDTKIGTWIDNRAIFRRVIQIQPSQFTSNTTSITIDDLRDLDVLVRLDLLWDYGNTESKRTFPAVFYNNAAWSGQVFVYGAHTAGYNTLVSFELGNNILDALNNTNNAYIYAVIEYVKFNTTD